MFRLLVFCLLLTLHAASGQGQSSQTTDPASGQGQSSQTTDPASGQGQSSQTTNPDCAKKIEKLEKTGRLIKELKVLCPKNPCDENSEPITGSTPCPKYCVVYIGVCYAKSLNTSEIVSNESANKVLENLLKQARKDFHNKPAPTSSSSSSDNNDTSIRGKNLFIGGGVTNQQLPFNPFNPFGTSYNPFNPTAQGSDVCRNLCPSYGCQQQQFPYNCNLRLTKLADTIQLLEPPINIPYCVRIPCRPNQPYLEINQTACLAVPGCYYDLELSFRRSGIPGVLPGVPVCHLAVRNNHFQRLASEFTIKTRQPWNALYTRCLINQNIPAISTPDPGCNSLNLFLFVNGHPKIAGWAGITQRECQLINACWLPHKGGQGYNCFYPTVANGIQVRAGKDPQVNVNPRQTDIYGRQLCRPFVTNSPQGYLNSYYECKEAGCVVDNSVNRDSLYFQLYQFLISQRNLHPYVQRLAIQDVINGKITPTNYRQELNKMLERTRCQIQRTPTIPNFSNIPILPNSLNLNSVSGKNFNLNQQTGNIQAICSTFFRNNFNVFTGNQQLASLCSGLFQNPNFGCPYQNLFAGGYPPLKGSFAGCCQKNLCYIPRPQIITQRSGSTPFLSEWSEWTSCSASCGGGIRNRTKTCIQSQLDKIHEMKCEESSKLTIQSKRCNEYKCPELGEWTNWSQCSAQYGTGEKTRTRICVNAINGLINGGCKEKLTDSETCESQCNCVRGEWGPWGSCRCVNRSWKQERTCRNPSSECNQSIIPKETKGCVGPWWLSCY